MAPPTYCRSKPAGAVAIITGAPRLHAEARIEIDRSMGWVGPVVINQQGEIVIVGKEAPTAYRLFTVKGSYEPKSQTLTLDPLYGTTEPIRFRLNEPIKATTTPHPLPGTSPWTAIEMIRLLNHLAWGQGFTPASGLTRNLNLVLRNQGLEIDDGMLTDGERGLTAHFDALADALNFTIATDNGPRQIRAQLGTAAPTPAAWKHGFYTAVSTHLQTRAPSMQRVVNYLHGRGLTNQFWVGPLVIDSQTGELLFIGRNNPPPNGGASSEKYIVLRAIWNPDQGRFFLPAFANDPESGPITMPFSIENAIGVLEMIDTHRPPESEEPKPPREKLTVVGFPQHGIDPHNYPGVVQYFDRLTPGSARDLAATLDRHERTRGLRREKFMIFDTRDLLPVAYRGSPPRHNELAKDQVVLRYAWDAEHGILTLHCSNRNEPLIYVLRPAQTSHR